jgi:serine/threonine-protein kinase
MAAGPDPTTLPNGPLVGQLLKQFRIVGKLGEGGMGVVYKALDETLRREVALKVLPEELAGDEERRRRFLREARSAAAVTHPNIATVYEIGEADGHVFIAMELIAGRTLRELIDGGMPHADALRVAKEVARGLARAHEKGVVHRDLKPENVMVTDDGGVKILDFGLAKLHEPTSRDAAPANASHMTVEGRIMGTPGYMSPEQAEGRSDVGAPSDVFSFGVMLYEMLAGARPFSGASSIAVLYAVMHVEPAPLASVVADLPPELVAVVDRCLKKRPAERFQSGRELMVELGGEGSQRLEGRPLSGRAPPMEKLPTVSGLGTALGATVASGTAGPSAPTAPPAGPPQATVTSGTAHPPASFTPAPAPPTSGGRWALVAGGLALLLVGGAAAAWFAASTDRPPSVTTSTGSSPSSGSATAAPSAAKHAIDMTDHPLPASSNRDATMAYASAIRRLRTGAAGAFGDLEKAVALDPTMGAAQLRVVLYAPMFPTISAQERRTRYDNVKTDGKSLEPRDQALLTVAEVLAEDPPELSRAAARVKKLLERNPEDAELALLHFIYLQKGGGRARDAKAAGREVLELDPHATQVLNLEAWSAVRQPESGGEDPASLLNRCLELSPDATGCRITRAALDAETGKCDAELAGARELVKLEPDDRRSYTLLAQALDATGARPEAVKTALDQAEVRRIATDPHEPAGLAALVVALAAGDFAAADAALLALVPSVATSSSELDHANIAAMRIAIAEETGSHAKALDIAVAHQKQAQAWNDDAPLVVRLKRVYLAHEAATLTDVQFVQQRDRHLESWLAKRGGGPGLSVERMRLLKDAEYSETPAEARLALPHDQSLMLTPVETHDHPFAYGHLLLLAGRGEEAAPLLEKATRACHGIPDALTLDFERLETPLLYIQAHVALGEAYELRGDKADACKAYGVVQARWKGAKPRSVSLDKANERAKALGCPAPPTRP